MTMNPTRPGQPMADESDVSGCLTAASGGVRGQSLYFHSQVVGNQRNAATGAGLKEGSPSPGNKARLLECATAETARAAAAAAAAAAADADATQTQFSEREGDTRIGGGEVRRRRMHPSSRGQPGEPTKKVENN